MNKERELQKIAEEISKCRLCKKGGTGKAVPGEGNPNARVVFVGEAPGKEEARIGRPFIGRSGKFLRRMILEAGLIEEDVFITSPGHYLPLRGTPSKEAVVHGRGHLVKQLAVIAPELVVLLGKTACFALLDRAVAVAEEHGTLVEKEGRRYFITLHPAYAMRFPEGKKQFTGDLEKIRLLVKKMT
jgi:uracil-DNA glycosylase